MGVTKIDSAGRQFIYRQEGVRLEAYKDVAGIPTIGVGFTWYPDTGKKVQMGDKITQEQCDEIFDKVVSTFEKGVSNVVNFELNQNQFNALVSFTYNVGLKALDNSTLLKKINEKAEPSDIKIAFMMWIKAGGKINDDLKKRRLAEANLYLK